MASVQAVGLPLASRPSGHLDAVQLGRGARRRCVVDAASGTEDISLPLRLLRQRLAGEAVEGNASTGVIDLAVVERGVGFRRLEQDVILVGLRMVAGGEDDIGVGKWRAEAECSGDRGGGE